MSFEGLYAYLKVKIVKKITILSILPCNYQMTSKVGS